MFDLRPEGHDTYRCVPVCSSVVYVHAPMVGDMAKDTGLTSLVNIGEANITGETREIFSCSMSLS